MTVLLALWLICAPADDADSYFVYCDGVEVLHVPAQADGSLSVEIDNNCVWRAQAVNEAGVSTVVMADDIDLDGDIDGKDLSALIPMGFSLSYFALHFGEVTDGR